MELIQNAEDNEYVPGVRPTLEFVFTTTDVTGTGSPATLLVFNNEVGFTKANIDSLCSIGQSTKKNKRRQGFIGEKGEIGSPYDSYVCARVAFSFPFFLGWARGDGLMPFQFSHFLHIISLRQVSGAALMPPFAAYFDSLVSGIGFKSVFLVSKQTYIFSNGYQIRFNEVPNEDCGIGHSGLAGSCLLPPSFFP
ncbi:unnamed protein product [Ilex paraguariensis]|uniref:Uncharacterized protein n=1 Tax=Ilex paraguariensis TaxID=185542 RepID=A0ABC8V436_9AQUA